MEGGRRSGEPSGYVVKNKNSKGCLIVRKKAVDCVGGTGSLGSYKGFHTKHDKKRPRMNFSDSGSSDELLMQPRRRLGPKTMINCNGLSGYEKDAAEESDVRRKRSREEEIRRTEVDLADRNVEDLLESKRNKLGMYEFDEYEGNDGGVVRRGHLHDEDHNCEDEEDGMEGRRYFGSMTDGRSDIRREYETGSSRYDIADGRKSLCFDRTGRLSKGSHGDRDLARSSMSFWRDKYDSDEPIRVQGKNGVLKVMVNKKNKIGGSFSGYDHLEADHRKGLRTDNIVKKNALVCPPFYSDSKSSEKASSYSRKEKSLMNLKKPQPAKNGKISDRDSETSDTLVKFESKNVESHKSAMTPLPVKRYKVEDMDSDDSDMSPEPGPENLDTLKPMKGTSSGGEKTPSNHLLTARMSEGKVKRGTGTEKQKLRERIREMLLNSGWTIDYRPRRNRDYLDAVYINPSGTAYWSIIKAYDALLKQINDDEDDVKSGGEGSSFMPLSDEVLSQLTRKTRKKIEKELKKKQRDAGQSEKAKETAARKSLHIREDGESRDSGSREEKLSSFIKQGNKSLKGKMSGNCSISIGSKGQNSTHHFDDSNERPVSGSTSPHGRKSKKLGRCTLLIRNSNSGLYSESDCFVPYVGKRTLLSWLIDCGFVQSSQKVRYMNRRRTKVMLEGWVTREGIHCGCCSKILTVSKFEIHAGSKLRQPFQNIYLDSGISLLDCQIEAWSKQESDEHIGFHSVDTDGDDPNDDTCGLCGDGGDLICCDSCPSTFHLSCLDIQMLPPGDWHCPNCTCKFCGRARRISGQEDDLNASLLQTCSLCAKKYHKLCSLEMDTFHVDANNSVPCFCGNKCRQLFEQLQRYLGVKHELDSGFTWSLIHRTDEDSEMGLPQRIECNSKLAVALSVMDECFLPIVDRRSGINLLHSVLYNCGSNFSRLNFNGFYTVILERGDEIISAASIRFHATQLAEMPFIGTRHMYRRQGMCRRLFQAIETALSSMKIEKLIIPAISELANTWTNVFGFTNLDESLKQKLKSMNMLVFPGIDMLQKQLVEQENVNRDEIATTDAELTFKGSDNMKFEMANKPDNDVSWARHEIGECNNSNMELASEMKELATADSDSQYPDVSLNDASVINGSLDAPHELKTRHADSESGNKLVEYALDTKSLGIADTLNRSQEMDSKSISDSSVENNCESSVRGDMRTVDSFLEGKSLCISDESHEVPEKNRRPELVKDSAGSRIQGDNITTDSDVLLPGMPSNDASVFSSSVDVSGELQNPLPLEGTLPANSKVGDELLESASDGKSLIFSNTSCKKEEENDDNSNAPALNLNQFASGDPPVSASVEENMLVSKSDGQSSNEKIVIQSDAREDTLNIESKPILESTVEDNGQSCREANSGDADSMDVDTSLEAVPSTKQTATENSAKQLDETSSVSVAKISGATDNSL